MTLLTSRVPIIRVCWEEGETFQSFRLLRGNNLFFGREWENGNVAQRMGGKIFLPNIPSTSKEKMILRTRPLIPGI